MGTKAKTGDNEQGPLRSQGVHTTILAVLTAGALLLPACARHAQPTRAPRLVLLYSTCTVNKSHLSPYAPQISYTPHLARFASQARVFTRYQVEEGMSGPAFASLLTGRQADRHGIFSHPAPLDEDNDLISEVFERAGYQTYFWDDHPIATAALGFAQGVAPRRVKQGLLKAGEPAFAHLLERLQREPELHAYVGTSFTVTHGAYGLDRVEPFCGRHPEVCGELTPAEILRWGELYHANRLALERNYAETARRLRLSARERERLLAAIEVIYSSRVEYLDELFGAVVRAVDDAGLAADSLIVFTADHGETLFRTNAPFKWTHGYMLEPDDLSPPLLLRGAGLAPGRYEGIARSIDVLPTVAALAGLGVPPDSVSGVDLAPALRGAGPVPELTAFSHTMLVPHEVFARSEGFTLFRRYFRELDAPGMWVAARRGDQFYRLRSRLGHDLPMEHYDLSQDPGLARNLFDPAQPAAAQMRDALVAYKRRLVEAHTRGAAGRAGVSAIEEQDRLRSLGYIQ